LFVDSVHVDNHAELLDGRPQLMIEILLALRATKLDADEVSLTVYKIHVHRVLCLLSRKRPRVYSELS